jgi:hypothetical protein
MPGPAPKAAGARQRRNRHASAATLDALPAKYAPLPDIRWSAIKCAFKLADGSVCPEPSWHHTKTWFQRDEANAKAMTEMAGVLVKPLEPHDYDAAAIAWRPTTLAWWAVIWASPMALEWVDADVPGLFALALLVDDFWTGPDSKQHAEIRQASREFGLSPFSRRQLQWEIRRLEVGKPATPALRKPPAPKPGGVLSVLEGGKARAPRRKAAAE